jgi:hypothetical protein
MHHAISMPGIVQQIIAQAVVQLMAAVGGDATRRRRKFTILLSVV